MIVTAILLIVSSVALTVTAFSDPGIIPRIATAEVDWDSRKDPPRIQSFGISGRIIDIKWCPTCKVFRPPRAFHCNICQNCVERFDHHCPWIGNCIGIRNYGWFSCFVYTLFIQAIWMLAMTIEIVRLGAVSSSKGTGWEKFVDGLAAEPVAVGLVFYIFIGMWFVIGLAFFHMYLVLTSKTTNEQLKGTYPHGSPFSHGIVFNIVEMCCKLPKSQVHIHHTPPKLSTHRESFINKQRVVYVSDDEMTATDPTPIPMSMTSDTGSLQAPNHQLSSSIETDTATLTGSASSFRADSSLRSHTIPSPVARSHGDGNDNHLNRFSTSAARNDGNKFDVVDVTRTGDDDSSEVSENDLLARRSAASKQSVEMNDAHAIVPPAM